jgi:hypothetical protein
MMSLMPDWRILGWSRTLRRHQQRKRRHQQRKHQHQQHNHRHETDQDRTQPQLGRFTCTSLTQLQR